MLSEQTIQTLNQLHETEDAYRPSSDITAQLGAKTIIMVIGATCQGKNLVMDTAVKLDERFHIAHTRTSRPPRAGDEPGRYTYFENSDEGLRPVFEAIQNHAMVQYAVNPYSPLIYGSMPADYPTEYNLADVISSAVDNFRHLGFKRTIAITVVSEPTSWLQRFEERFPAGDAQRKARKDEAIESLSWSLSQETDHYWVHNVDGQPELAAEQVIAIASGTSNGQPEARKLAEACLEAARSIAA
ncbi:MAG TPA: hypothetical protein VLG92_05620 [Candidatus Saccharimonadia bacterium]|nr:hypothetical protein [Candidatus Saccharimonadia bacterium]